MSCLPFQIQTQTKPTSVLFVFRRVKFGDMLNANDTKTQCTHCYYKNGKLVTMCGFCEEKDIAARIQWWQQGKKKLKEKSN